MSDLISRQAAIEALEKHEKSKGHNYTLFVDIVAECEEIILDLPSVQPERKRGKWINGACNQCGSHAPYWPMASTYYTSNYCPNCGADMRGKEDEQ